jgi:hypothetical protein
MLASFLGVLPILTPPLCALTFILCSKSNPIVVFALDLMSTYESHLLLNDGNEGADTLKMCILETVIVTLKK